MFKQRLKKDRRGLTLIELVCAIAILAIISATVGGAMVVATNSYRSGTVETALQQEAQFTANLIESLIVDATDTVEYVGNVLTIANVDYTYEITYDAGNQVLTYIQYITGDASSRASAVSQMLAEHVSSFNVDTSDFTHSRNVRITISMENAGKSFSTAYNITSRNDPNSGDPIEETASILCLDNITLEPLQEYFFNVSVVGPANKGFHCYIEPEADGMTDATATVVSGGIMIKIGESEDGGDDGLLRMYVVTDATNAHGPLKSRQVIINIRRVNSIGFSNFKLLSGSDKKADAIYTVTATPVGTNLEKVPGAAFDTDYVDPNTIKWSLDMVGGSGTVNEYAEILNPPGDIMNEVQVRLKKDITSGTILRIVATAYHPEGTRGTQQTNKTSQKYGTVKDYVELTSEGIMTPRDDIIRRGGETNIIDVNIGPDDLVKQEWDRNHPGQPMPDKDRYNGGFTGNIYYRYKSTDDEHTSAGYPNWIKMAEQGSNDYFKINAADLAQMKFMKDYDFEILYGFKYNNGNNQTVYYPAAAYPGGTTTPIANVDPTYVYTFPIYAFSIMFDVCQDSNWPPNTINLGPYLSADGNGIGTLYNPLKVPYCQTITLKYSNVIGARSDRGEVDNMPRSSYKRVGNSWTKVNTGFQHKDKYNIQSGSFTFDPVNNQMSRGVVYKIVLESVAGETYAYEPVDGMGGRGIIYLMLE